MNRSQQESAKSIGQGISSENGKTNGVRFRHQKSLLARPTSVACPYTNGGETSGNERGEKRNSAARLFSRHSILRNGGQATLLTKVSTNGREPSKEKASNCLIPAGVDDGRLLRPSIYRVRMREKSGNLIVADNTCVGKHRHSAVIPLDSRTQHSFNTPSFSGSDDEEHNGSCEYLQRLLSELRMSDAEREARRRVEEQPATKWRNSTMLPLSRPLSIRPQKSTPSRAGSAKSRRSQYAFSNDPHRNASRPHTSSIFHKRPTRMKGGVMRIVVLGSKRVGKTAFLHQLAKFLDPLDHPYTPTIEDTYQIETHASSPDRHREIMIFHDTAGLSGNGLVEVKRPHLMVADAFLLVYSVLDRDSFNRVDQLKLQLEKQLWKEKKEVPIVVVGTMADLDGRQVETEFALHWATHSKVRLCEISNRDRGAVVDVVYQLACRFFQPAKDGKFSLTKRLKPEKSNAQIMMDF